MIKVNVIKKDNIISNIKVSGHSGYDEHGRDIVCASISSIITTTVNGILSLNKTIEVSDDGELLEIKVLKSNEIINKLLQNMLKLFEGIEIQYKKNLKVIMKGE